MNRSEDGGEHDSFSKDQTNNYEIKGSASSRVDQC